MNITEIGHFMEIEKFWEIENFVKMVEKNKIWVENFDDLNCLFPL